MKTGADLMTEDPLSLLRSASLKDAHDLIREKNIRHIPVIDEQGYVVGMLRQDDKLVGMLISSDFVRLAAALLA